MERSYKNVVRPWEDVPEQYTVLLKNRHDNGYAYAEAYEGNSLVTPSSGKGGFGNTFRIWLNSWDLVEKRPEPEKFKVGDKVLSNGTWLPKHEIHTVNEVNSMYGLAIKGYQGWYSPAQFTLVEPESNDMKQNTTEPEEYNPWLKQAGGKHYTDMQEQPLQRTLRVKGYTAFAGACYTKVNKYMDRVKDNEAVQLAKAAHVLELWAYEAKKREEPEND